MILIQVHYDQLATYGREMAMKNDVLREMPFGCPAGGGMDLFIHRQNVERYRRLLAATTDETRRQQLLKLLAEEEARRPSAPPNSDPESPREIP
jgi:hypothetical protein